MFSNASGARGRRFGFRICSAATFFRPSAYENIFTFIWMNIIHLFLCYILFLGEYLLGASVRRASFQPIGSMIFIACISLKTAFATFKHQ